ncbi:YbjQ family protein [Lacunimicrobium album]
MSSSQQSNSGEKNWFWLVISSVKSYFSQQRKILNYRLKRPFSVLLEDAKVFAMEELTVRAEAMGGNAIIAIRIEYHTWNQVLIVSSTVVTINEQTD